MVMENYSQDTKKFDNWQVIIDMGFIMGIQYVYSSVLYDRTILQFLNLLILTEFVVAM